MTGMARRRQLNGATEGEWEAIGAAIERGRSATRTTSPLFAGFKIGCAIYLLLFVVLSVGYACRR